MRILLVEDHAELSHWVAKALRDARLTVECAATGADAEVVGVVRAAMTAAAAACLVAELRSDRQPHHLPPDR